MAVSPVILVILQSVCADVNLNSPRGSNNKLSEQSNNAQNQNRLFDSQNNAAAGYQIGDRCSPVCQDGGRNYDENQPGAMQGVMTVYHGSELYIEWHNQHGCGLGHPNLRCQMILQYMSTADNSGLRDGTKRGNDNTAGGQQEPPEVGEAADPTLGQHETVDYYQACRARERNQGLYTADQQVRNDRGATATRQNPNGNANANDRHGLECPEERDHYPYWHPTPWHDIAILTDEPVARCAYYREESQNVKPRGYCSQPEFNNQEDCVDGNGDWKTADAFNEPPPECVGGVLSRDNHNGNVRNGRPMYYKWKVPELEGSVVVRLRYNISTYDFEPSATINQEGPASEQHDIKDSFFIDESFNDRDPSQRRRSVFQGGPTILTQDPKADWLNLGSDADPRILQLQVNTNQYGRTFEDRTHTIRVQPRPSHVPDSARIVNYNVRGRRGNIVQVYPSVEYDFIPEDLTVEQGTFMHFQWVGSDANPKGNAGNGRQGTDRSNLVQVGAKGENVPLPIERHTLFFDAQNEPPTQAQRDLVDRLAYLDQSDCDVDENNQDAITNCKQLNGASAHFDGGLVEMTQVGTHHLASTRNNDFTNRSQKSSITVTRSARQFFIVLGVSIGVALLGAVLAYCCIARCRSRTRSVQDSKTMKNTITRLHEHPLQRWLFGCLHGQCLLMTVFTLLNVVVFVIGFLSNIAGGFGGSMAYPFAKGFGYSLDLNAAVVILPTLRSLQTALRGAGSTREWIPIDDPIAFHVAVGGLIAMGSVGHIVAHIIHMLAIAGAPTLQEDPFLLWDITDGERLAGAPLWSQAWDIRYRCAPVTGVIVAIVMAAMYATALPCARRGTNCVTKRLGGYTLFWRVHNAWKLVFVLLLLHAPARLWIWLFFPALFLIVDRMLLANQQRPYVELLTAKLLPRDVMRLMFAAPEGFTYEAGQYILLGWRGEWHAFTLTSAPEERFLSVHIRAPESLDWCSALRHRLLVEAPMVTGGGAAPDERIGVEFRKKSIGNVVYCQPCQPHERTKSGEPTASTHTALPADAVLLQISGPFGAPAQKVWKFKTIMAVGAGIGVTPFASILRSVNARATQQDVIQRAVGASGSRADRFAKGKHGEMQELMEDVITVPTRIYFYWIVRCQEEVDWFVDLLTEAIDGPAKRIVHISLFTTGEIDLKQVNKLNCVHDQFFGRPNWSPIFKQNKESHKDEHIGVFLCGSSAIGKELEYQSTKNTDAPDHAGGTRFSFFTEHF